MDLKPQYTSWNSEISEENIRNTLQDKGARKKFCKRTTFAQELSQTMIKLDFINQKAFYGKGNSNWVRKSTQSGKESLSSIHLIDD